MAAGELTDEQIGLAPPRELSDADIGLMTHADPQAMARERGSRGIPSIVPNPRQPSRPDWLRPGYEATGATAGAALGAPGGPPGMLVGGALGAMLGSGVYDLVQDIGQRTGFPHVPSNAPIPGVRERVENMARAGTGEFLWGGAGAAVGPFAQRGINTLTGKVLGLRTPEARRMTDLAQRQNIGVGALHVSPRKWVRGYSKVVGVFPFVGTPLREGQARVVGDINERAADLLNTLAPRAATRMDVSKELTRAAANNYKKFRGVGAALYDNFYELADNLSVREIVPTSEMKARLAGLGERAGKEAITLKSGEQWQPPKSDDLGDWLAQINELPDLITVEQARGLQRQLNEIIKAPDGAWDVSRAIEMAEAIKESIHSPDLSRLTAAEAQPVARALDVANQFWTENASVFETATALRFGRVDRNIFGKSFFKAGSLNRDEVFNAVFRSGSVDALQDLRKLVGEKPFQKAASEYLGEALRRSHLVQPEGSLVDEIFSAQKFEELLKLNTRDGQKALQEMLKGSGLGLNDFNGFLEAAKTATDITIRDPSTFVARRATLGGAAGVMGGLVIGAGKVSLPKAVLLSYITRQFSKGLMSPTALRRLTRSIRDNATEQQKRMLIMRVIEAAQQDVPERPPHVMPPIR